MIVAVARHHVARVGDVDIFGVRDEIEKFLHIRFADKLRRAAADQQRRNLDAARSLHHHRLDPLAIGGDAPP